jgi:hypothetical protein
MTSPKMSTAMRAWKVACCEAMRRITRTEPYI